MKVLQKIKWLFLIVIPRICSSVYHICHVDSIAVNVFCEEDHDGTLKHKNWGDDLNMYLLPLIADKHVYNANKSLIHNRFVLKNYSCIGSIIGFYENTKTEIWGSGVACKDVILRKHPKKVHSVRGKYTREFLVSKGIDCPEVYGDPALLISKYYKAVPIGKYRLGIIPHYNDLENEIIKEFVSVNSEVLLIDLVNYDKWSDICDKIVSCECIISSSLHGLIVSDSYGVPNIWVRFSDRIYGGNFKYIDYFSSVDRNDKEPMLVSELSDLYDLEQKAVTHKLFVNINYDMILESCPFKK